MDRVGKHCNKCDREIAAQNQVYQEPPISPCPLVVVRLMPTRYEDQSGRAFSDMAARFLRAELTKLIRPEEVFYTHLVKCGSFKKRVLANGEMGWVAVKPKKLELGVCQKRFFFNELAACQPEIIVALGRDAFAWITRISAKEVAKLEPGVVYEDYAYPTALLHEPVFALTHPSKRWQWVALLRQVCKRFIEVQGRLL